MIMSENNYPLLQEGSSVLVYVTVHPRSKKNRVTKMDAKSLHIDIKAAPKQGEANEALLVFFAQFLELPFDSLVIKKGHTSHKKVILIKNSTVPDIVKKISIGASL